MSRGGGRSDPMLKCKQPKLSPNMIGCIGTIVLLLTLCLMCAVAGQGF